jgi:hypothetical protein
MKGCSPQVARTSLSLGRMIIPCAFKCCSSSFKVGNKACAMVLCHHISRTDKGWMMYVSYLCPTEMNRLKGNIPFDWKIHTRCVRLLVFHETDSNYIPLAVLQEKADGLETASVSCPAPCARYASREWF